MFIKKRGVSPLLATILLIAFVVVIALLVWFWYSDLMEEYRDKEGQKIKVEFTCASNVEISVNLINCNQSSSSFDLKNKGTVELRSFYAIGSDNSGIKDSITIDVNLKQGGITNTGAEFNLTSLKEFQIIPILNGISCTQKQITLSC